MLTPNEQVELAKLQEKAKSYVPLTDDEWSKFEHEVREAYHGQIDVLSAIGNIYADTIGRIARQNSRLVQEALYWKTKANEEQKR